MMSTKKRMRLLHHFVSFMSDKGYQPAPPSPEKGGHEQVPMASTSYWVRDGNDIFGGNVSMEIGGGANPIEVTDRTIVFELFFNSSWQGLSVVSMGI